MMHSARRIAHAVSLVAGLAVAIIGLVNVLPAYPGLPRLGPFAVEWFRPLFFWLSTLTASAALLAQRQSGRLPAWLDTVLLALAVAAMGYACWEYWRIGLVLKNSVMFFSPREAWVATLAAAVALFLCWRVWGGAIALLGAVAFAYLATGSSWPGFLRTAPNNMVETISQNIWYATDQGILGDIMGIVLSTVLPFIILGSILEGTGAGKSMIRVSFRLMRAFKGGPAYAAITASALFGTVSGSAVANVVGTGVVTIPMIRRRGFSPNFAGAVEAAASTGGQILPPIMGAAALVMADLLGVSYLTVITAALVPGIAFYISLFLAVYFEANRLGIRPEVELDPDLEVTGQDIANLLLVFGPIALIVYLLIGGASPAGASIAAIGLLVPLSFINPEIRRAPWQLITAFANGGRTVGQLAIAIAVVGIVVATLSATGMPTKFAVLLSAAAETSLLASLVIAALGCVVLGMGMPTLPAYIAIVVVMGPTLQGFGLELLTVHMFVFFFGVASVITPPVAIASYAAAAISQGRPIATAVTSSRIGAMIFLIPFAFAFNPELLMSPEATPNGYSPWEFGLSIICLGAALYLCASGLGGFDRARLNPLDRLLRLGATACLLAPPIGLNLLGLLIGLGVVAFHLNATRAPRADLTETT